MAQPTRKDLKRNQYDSFASAAALSVCADLGENPEVTGGNDAGDALKRSTSFKEINLQELTLRKRFKGDSPNSDRNGMSKRILFDEDLC